MTSQHLELPPIEVMPKDLSAYRAGNRGVDYVHTFDSGRPGPHVIVNGLTHGNEFCGMVAVTHLFEQGMIHPRQFQGLEFVERGMSQPWLLLVM